MRYLLVVSFLLGLLASTMQINPISFSCHHQQDKKECSFDCQVEAPNDNCCVKDHIKCSDKDVSLVSKVTSVDRLAPLPCGLKIVEKVKVLLSVNDKTLFVFPHRSIFNFGDPRHHFAQTISLLI